VYETGEVATVDTYNLTQTMNVVVVRRCTSSGVDDRVCSEVDNLCAIDAMGSQSRCYAERSVAVITMVNLHAMINENRIEGLSILIVSYSTIVEIMNKCIVLHLHAVDLTENIQSRESSRRYYFRKQGIL
jgi:hypothetical protein